MNLESDIHILNIARLGDLFFFYLLCSSVTWKKVEMNTD